MLRHLTGAAAWAVLLALTGCSLLPARTPEVPQRPLPGDQLVFLVHSWGGGLAPPLNLSLSAPALAVYGDGRVVAYDEAAVNADVPTAYLLHRVGPDAVAAFVADAEGAGLVDDRTDFGSPGVTDAPVTRVLLHGGERREVSLYAFSERVEGDLGWRQRRARKALRQIVDRAFALPGGVAGRPYRPEQVRVTALDPGPAPADGPIWPGPDPTRFLDGPDDRCGTLSGPAAQRVYAAARVNPGQRWSVAGRPQVLAVVALLPGTDDCR